MTVHVKTSATKVCKHICQQVSLISSLDRNFDGRPLPYCCGASEVSEQQNNQDLREIYKVGRILEFITFYQNALHLTRVHCATFYQNALRQRQLN